MDRDRDLAPAGMPAAITDHYRVEKAAEDRASHPKHSTNFLRGD
jgi:hypothetical protein